MADPNISLGAGLGFGLESAAAYGTVVARTNWLRCVNATLRRQIDRRPVPHLGTEAMTSYVRREFYDASDTVTGGFQTIAAYDDSTALLLGHCIDSVPGDAGGPTYTHTFTLTKDQATSLTIEQMIAEAKAILFEGCMINSWRLACSPGELMTFTATDVIGETSGAITAAGSPTYSTTQEYIKHSHAGSLAWDSLSDKVNSFDLSVNRNLQRRLRLGSLHTVEPRPVGFTDIALRVTREWDEDTVHASYLSGATGDATISFTGTSPHVLAITLHNCYCAEISGPVASGPGIITDTIELRPLADTTDAGLTIVLTNAKRTWRSGSREPPPAISAASTNCRRLW
jgi:hypothetical protein